LSFLMVSDAISAPGVRSWNRPCIKFYSQWQKKPNHKAFAVSTTEYQQSCGGSWGEKSLKAAIDSAKRWCKKHAEGAPCVITKSE
jgi:hypothetical protein